MSVLESLAREHRLFERLLRRLSAALDAQDEEAGRFGLESVLLVLFPAMERHEEVEALVFDTEEYAARPGAKELLREAGLQHDALSALRKDVLLILSNPERYSWEHLRSLVNLLIVHLRGHFTEEEQKLWPHYRRAMVRSAGRTAERPALEKAAGLERELAKRGVLIQEFLDRRPPR